MRLFRHDSRLPVALLLSSLLAGCTHKNQSQPPGAADSSRLKAGMNDSAASASVLQLTYEQRQGRNLFSRYCLVCHGTEGKGDGFNSFNLDPKPRDLTDAHYMNTLTNERLAQTIRDGGRSVNRSSLMPSWGGRLSKDELVFVAAYVRSLAAESEARR
jgi:cytochrome c oxidase cbb3-type subunit III